MLELGRTHVGPMEGRGQVQLNGGGGVAQTVTDHNHKGKCCWQTAAVTLAAGGASKSVHGMIYPRSGRAGEENTAHDPTDH